jgi:hypothetical protein
MVRIIVTIIFLLAIILFLMPWISVSCAGTEIMSASGLDMVRGSYNIPSEFSDDTNQENEPIVIGVLAAAAVGLIFSFFKGGVMRVLRVISGLAGAGLLVWLKFKFDDQIRGEEEGILQINYQIGYWLTLGSLAVAAVLSIFDGGNKKQIIDIPAASTQSAPPPRTVLPQSPPQHQPPPSPPLSPPPSQPPQTPQPQPPPSDTLPPPPRGAS